MIVSHTRENVDISAQAELWTGHPNGEIAKEKGWGQRGVVPSLVGLALTYLIYKL